MARIVWLDYQSERHCAKTSEPSATIRSCWITSQNDTAPKPGSQGRQGRQVGLPVRTTLRQNVHRQRGGGQQLDYQSERHCAKTGALDDVIGDLLDYQSERHCAKTAPPPSAPPRALDYQSERHCAKTHVHVAARARQLDYQSERHCAKTVSSSTSRHARLDYQSERHCAKTTAVVAALEGQLDYQSERHCAKTVGPKSPLQRDGRTDWVELSMTQENTGQQPFSTHTQRRAHPARSQATAPTNPNKKCARKAPKSPFRSEKF